MEMILQSKCCSNVDSLSVFCQLNNPKVPSVRPSVHGLQNTALKIDAADWARASPPRHLRQFAAMIASVSPPRFAILHGTYTIQKYTWSSARHASFMKRENMQLSSTSPTPAVTCCGGGRENSGNEHHRGQKEELESQILK